LTEHDAVTVVFDYRFRATRRLHSRNEHYARV